MAPELGKPIHQLPLVPANVLKKHHVHEPLDTRFRRGQSSRLTLFPIAQHSIRPEIAARKKVALDAGLTPAS
jgi:hypothetical protein